MLKNDILTCVSIIKVSYNLVLCINEIRFWEETITTPCFILYKFKE